MLYRPETVYGEVAPADAPTTRLRTTGGSPEINKATVLSEEIRSDRQRTAMPLVGIDIGGDISHEFIYGAETDALLQAVLCGTWATNVLRNGVTNRSFGIEAGFLDIAKYIYFRGCIPSRLSLDITARQIVKMGVSWMGQRGTFAGTTIAGVTVPTAPSANAPMKAGSGISILSAGSANTEMVGVSCRKISLDIQNTLRPRELATSEYNDEPGRSVMEITGTIETYFNEITRSTAFVANGAFAAKFRLTDLGLTAPNSYDITLPSMQITSAPVPITGNEADVYQTFSFRALLDAALGYSINIARAVTP